MKVRTTLTLALATLLVQATAVCAAAYKAKGMEPAPQR
jgi:hypothetical protein